jgi:hypothetical protein
MTPLYLHAWTIADAFRLIRGEGKAVTCPRSPKDRLRQQRLNHFSMHIGKPEIAALEMVG